MNAHPISPGLVKFKWAMRLFVVLVIGAGLGFVLRPVAERQLFGGPPTTDTVIDALIQPVPIPDGATILRESRGGCGGGGSTVTWHTSMILDVTGLTKSQIKAIPEFYTSYFKDRIPGLAVGLGWQYDRYESGSNAVARMGANKYTTASGAAGCWRRRARAIGENLFCEVYVEVADFDVDPRRGSPQVVFYTRMPINDFDWDGPETPVQGRRVMYVQFSFVGSGLPGEVKRPPSGGWLPR